MGTLDKQLMNLFDSVLFRNVSSCLAWRWRMGIQVSVFWVNLIGQFVEYCKKCTNMYTEKNVCKLQKGAA